MSEIISLGHIIRIKDVSVRQRGLRHFHVTIVLRKPIYLYKANELIEQLTTCDRKYIEWVTNSQGFSMRETPDYRDITSSMEKSLYEYFIENGCPDDWLQWYSFRDTVIPKREYKVRVVAEDGSELEEEGYKGITIYKSDDEPEEVPSLIDTMELDEIEDELGIIPVNPQGTKEEKEDEND